VALELKQTVKLSQQLVMTPQLQQAIRLLQLSQLELMVELQQELVENPVLEEVMDDEGPADTDAELEAVREGEDARAAAEEQQAIEDGDLAASLADVAATTVEELVPERLAEGESDTAELSPEEMVADVDWESYFESRPQTSMSQSDMERPPPEENTSAAPSLAAHLMWQLGFVELTPAQREISALIVGNLNDYGYLQETVEGIAEAAGVTIDATLEVITKIQRLDPVGVAARDLRECLQVQAEVVGVTDPLVLAIIDAHLALLQRRDLRGIARQLDTTIEAVSVAADAIASFEPRPGRQYTSESPIYITPDIYVHKVGTEYHVTLNDDGMPRLRVSPTYRDVLARRETETKETRDYVRERLRSAVWMIKSINQRHRTIVKVMESIIRFQRDFFDRGSHALRPLNLRDVAEDIGMHESTVSRVTTNKYAQTPHGIFELKFFFNSSIQMADGDSIASESVKEKIREIISGEDVRRPLSDQRIAEVLATQSIRIARRTVTKYREALGILSSTTRKRFS
jgi:RNA polymerase sigma-54 factor